MNTHPESESHLRHMEALKRITDTNQRREYIEGVQRAEGRFAASWLKDEFARWWWKEQKK